MARDYSKFVGSASGIYLSRRNLVFIAFVCLVILGFRIFKQPTWLVQRLDAPNGERQAVLKRIQYFDHYFKVQAKSGPIWQTVYTSPAITNSYSVDLRERLFWSPDSARLYFSVQGQIVNGHDFAEGRKLTMAELVADQEHYTDQLAR